MGVSELLGGVFQISSLYQYYFHPSTLAHPSRSAQTSVMSSHGESDKQTDEAEGHGGDDA